jgi:SAM-dependent methyltransferase
MRAINLVAGNGWLASELAQVGVGKIVCVDASAAAAAAAERDHTGCFQEYLVLDMRRLSEAQRDQLMEFDFNALACVDPLAVEEPAPNAFTEAFNLLAPDGWVALHLSEDAAEDGSESRYARLIHHMIRGGALKIVTQERYRHRFTTHGEPVYHVALIGQKIRDFDPGEPQ